MAACLLKGTSSNPKPLQLDDAKVEIEKTLAIRGSISCEIIGRVWRPLRVFGALVIRLVEFYWLCPLRS